MIKAVLWPVLGFISGAVIGFAWSRGARAALPGRVKTAISGGVVTVKVDVKGAATDGLVSLFG